MRKLVVVSIFGILIVAGVITFLILILGEGHRSPVWVINGGNVKSGENAILGYGCFSCHVIPGIREGKGRVGPMLNEINNQIYIGGVLPNSPQNMNN
jgi:hypothetical protein